MEEVRNPEKDLELLEKYRDNEGIIALNGMSEIDEFFCMFLKALPWYIQQYQQSLELLKDNQYNDTLDIRISSNEHDGYYRKIPVCKYCGGFNETEYDSMVNDYGKEAMREHWIRGHSADCTLAKLLYSHEETEVSE